MGVIGTVVTFAAGYAVGTIRKSDPLGRAQGMARAVGQLMPGSRPDGRVDARQIRDVMTVLPRTVTLDSSLAVAARVMAEEDIGDVIVVENGSNEVAGIVTDRDITIRAIGEGLDPATTTVEDIFSRDMVTVAPDETVHGALDLMRGLNVRRLPVVEDGIAIGVVSLGDLSIETDVGGTLADISVAAPDR